MSVPSHVRAPAMTSRSSGAATTLLARSEARRHRGALVALVLIVAFVTAGVLAAAAGSRRTSSALDRFLDWSHAADVEMGAASPALANDPVAVNELAASLAALDGVEAIQTQIGYGLLLQTEYDFVLMAPLTSNEADLSRSRLLDGRWPDPSSPREVTLTELAVAQTGLGIGDVLVAPVARGELWEALFSGDGTAFETAAEEGHQVELDVVGITRDESSLSTGSTSSPIAQATPAFIGAYPNVGAIVAFTRLQVDPARFEVEAAHKLMSSAMGENGEVWTGEEGGRGATRTAFRWIATGLAIFSVVALAAGALAVLQTVARQVQLSREPVAIASALGMSRRHLVLAIARPIALTSIAGVVLGTTIALAASARFPISVARRAEVDPGVRVDPLVHVGGAAALAAGFVLAAIGFSFRQTRRRNPTRLPHGSRLAQLRTRLRPPAAYGSSAVLDFQDARRAGVRPWTALAGVAVALAGVTAILVFETSREAVASDPRRYGWTWDFKPDLTAADEDEAVEQLAADERVSAVGGVFCEEQFVAEEFVTMCAFVPAKGTIDAEILAGRAPNAPSEIALGRNTASRLGVRIGDQVQLPDGDGETVRFTLVGLAAIPLLSDADRPGRGALLTPEGLESVTGVPVFESSNSNLVLSVTEGLDKGKVATELADAYPLMFPSAYSSAEPPEVVQQLRRLRPSFVSLAFFLSALGALGLVHFLALSTRRRRGDFAVMQAIGFVRRQVGSSVVWQSATVALVGVAIGVPAGILVGRLAWSNAVDHLGMDVGVPVPAFGVSAIVAAAVLGAVAIATVPGWLASRTRPAVALRSE